MQHEITPHIGVAGFMLGMSRAECRAILPSLTDCSTKLGMMIIPADISEKDGIRLEYMEDDDGDEEKATLMSITLRAPASPAIFGSRLLNLRMGDAGDLLERLDPETYLEDDVFLSPCHGLEVGTDNPSAEDDDSLMHAPVTYVVVCNPLDEEHEEVSIRLEKEERDRRQKQSGK
ncbi:hypothetical protein DB346_17610 [Verrucomicrobia bacterium LW23]|nr:hypothetical protein DB346_17610 [Verrucomicrobia bacterium LW23]